MTLASLSTNDVRVRDGVLRELEWDSLVDASAIGVSAADGAVTLTGFIDSYTGKLAAERAAKRVRGVRAVANDIQVRLRLDRTDEQIAGDVARSLGMRVSLPVDVQATVHSGHVTLTGTVTSLFQRAVAEKSVHDVKGIKGIVNLIDVGSVESSREVLKDITRALHRDADIDARALNVTVKGHTVHLAGTVGSWHEREAAERAATHATGITLVDNRIVVAPAEPHTEDNEEIC